MINTAAMRESQPADSLAVQSDMVQNEAHTTLTNGIPTVDNVSYGRSINQSTTQPISTEKNLAYRNVANLNDPFDQAEVYDYVDVHNLKT